MKFIAAILTTMAAFWPAVLAASDTFTDDFSAGINPACWVVASNQPLYSVDMTHGDVRFSKPAGGSYTFQYIRLMSGLTAQGDFDARIDFTNASITRADGTPGNQVQFNASFGGQTFDVVRSDEVGSGQNGHVFVEPPTAVYGTRGWANLSGTLRITRTGAHVQGFIDSTLIYERDYNTGDAIFNLSLQNNSTRDATAVTFDNFRLVAAHLRPWPPAVTTLAATSVTGNRATLQASVNPNAASTDVTFQYSTDSALAGATTTTSQNIGSGSSAVAVSQPVSGLLANKTYYFRAVGSNSAGATQGSILSFTTLSLNDAPPTFAFKFGSLGSGNSQFNYPAGISTDSSGNLYVADSYNYLVKKFSSSGGFQAAVGPTTFPSADAVVDGNGDIFVVDQGAGYVNKFRIGVSGPILTFGGSTYITGRSGIAMDPDGNILVTDSKHNTSEYCYCVKKLKSDGSGVIWQKYGNSSSPLLWPVDVAVDTGGNVYVADQGGSRIVKLDSNGNYLLTWGSSGTGDGQFQTVRGVALDPSGRVYVAEDNNNGGHGRVQVFSSTGTFVTKWGSYDPSDTTFTCPVSVAFSPDGRVVYVSDYWAHQIKVFTYNAAPVLDASKTPVLAPVAVNAGAPSGAVGTPVTSLVDIGGTLSNVSDSDAGAVTGVAITAAAAASGTWYFTTNNGANWTLLGTPSSTSTRLLIASSSSRVYFQPNPGFSGTVASALTFRAWDQAYGVNGESADTSYSGGATAFSAGTDSADITVQVLLAGAVAQTIAVSGGLVTIMFIGIPDFDYDVERATDINGPWTTLTVPDPIHAPGTGQFSFTDTDPPSGAAYYRSIRH